MPVERRTLSVSQFAELMGVEPARLVGVEMQGRTSTVTIVLEPEDAMAQTTGAMPQLADNTIRKSPKGKGGKRAC